MPRLTFLTHGEQDRGFAAHVPEPGESIGLSAGAAA
jgi:hypothetical protein